MPAVRHLRHGDASGSAGWRRWPLPGSCTGWAATLADVQGHGAGRGGAVQRDVQRAAGRHGDLVVVVLVGGREGIVEGVPRVRAGTETSSCPVWRPACCWPGSGRAPGRGCPPAPARSNCRAAGPAAAAVRLPCTSRPRPGRRCASPCRAGSAGGDRRRRREVDAVLPVAGGGLAALVGHLPGHRDRLARRAPWWGRDTGRRQVHGAGGGVTRSRLVGLSDSVKNGPRPVNVVNVPLALANDITWKSWPPRGRSR